MMSKTTWLISLLPLIAACNGGGSSETGECYYSPKVEVPRADYDAAEDGGELSPEACESLCNKYLDPEESGGEPSVEAPECILGELGADVVTMECRVETGCA